MANTKNIQLGKNGEDIACSFLEKNGYKILERNKRFSKLCEIDIIALDKNTFVFCEVKTRKTNLCGNPFEAITRAKYNNIKKGIFLYLNENTKYKNFRIDAISIVVQPNLTIKHLKNI